MPPRLRSRLAEHGVPAVLRCDTVRNRLHARRAVNGTGRELDHGGEELGLEDRLRGEREETKLARFTKEATLTHVAIGVLRAAMEIPREALAAVVADAEPVAVVLDLVIDGAELEGGVAGGEDALSSRSLAQTRRRVRRRTDMKRVVNELRVVLAGFEATAAGRTVSLHSRSGSAHTHCLSIAAKFCQVSGLSTSGGK